MPSLRNVEENDVHVDVSLHEQQCKLLLHDGRLLEHLLDNDVHVSGLPWEPEVA